MKKLKWIIAIAAGICLAAVSAQAAFLNFTEPQYNPGPSSPTHTVNNVLPGIDITFTALGEAGTDPFLSWYTSANPDPGGGNDGYGVYNGGGYETDEVEFPEMILIEFSDTVMANSFYLTDFFIELGWDGYYRERGGYSLDGGQNWNLFSANAFSNNGFYIVDVDTELDRIWFSAFGTLINLQDSEFSIAGANVSAVPLPPAILLLGSGVLGLVALRRRRKTG